MVAGGKPDRKVGAAPGMKPQITSATWKGAQMLRAPSRARESFKDVRFPGAATASSGLAPGYPPLGPPGRSPGTHRCSHFEILLTEQ
jgi:hypothetical protein